MNGEIAARLFFEELSSGKIRKDVLPNHALNYTDYAEKEELNSYKRFIQTSSYDFITSYEAREYDGVE